VAPLSAIEPGEYKIVPLDDETQAAVFNLNGEFHAIEDLCSHDYSTLTGGSIEGDEIICPRHGARFCIKTGAALTPPAYEDIRVFATRTLNGMVQVARED